MSDNSLEIRKDRIMSQSIETSPSPESFPRGQTQIRDRSRSVSRVLVTGGTGFIGKNYLGLLNQQVDRIRIAVRSGGRSRLPALPGLDVCEIAMNRVEDWRRLVEGVDAVIHIAGATAGTRAELLQANRDITLALAKACSEVPNPPRLVYVSSLSAAGPSSSTRPRRPSDRAQPISDYGQTKYEGELAALAYADRVPTTILRPGIVFGPGDKELVRLIDPIARFGVNPMAGFLDPKIAFVHVEDLIDAICLAVTHGATCVGSEPHEGGGQGVYFVADPEFITLSQFARFVANGFGRSRVKDLRIPIPIVSGAATISERVSRWLGWRTTFNPDKIREASCAGWMCDVQSTIEELGWSPSLSLSQRLHQFAAMVRTRSANGMASGGH